MDSGFTTVDGIEYDEGVDFKVGKMKVDVDGVKSGEEVDEGVLLLRRNVGEEGRGNNIASRERCINGEVENESLGIDITNINTTLVGEEDAVTLALRVDANVIFGVGRMRKERFDDKVVQGTSDSFNLICVG